jgi:SAM-dependent methyltransferase
MDYAMTSLAIAALPRGADLFSASAFLDAATATLAAGDLRAVEAVALRLNRMRQNLSCENWHSYIDNFVAPHAYCALARQEPFCARAYDKPRGYAGDAPMLDLVYEELSATMRVTEMGRRLHAWTLQQPACRSVQARREILSTLIDDVAATTPAPRILSVACGHLREAQRSDAVRSGAVAELIALDQDRESLAVVEREQRANNVIPVHASIRRVVGNGLKLGTFDLAYAAGLYDYLDDSVAQALTLTMFRALRPGGRLVVANFAPNLRDIGYMEAIMDWRLIYRTETEMARLSVRIPAAEIAEREMFRDAPGNVVYLSLRRA